MPRRIVDLHHEAIAEAREARLWYAARSPQAEERFRAELAKAIETIRENPELCPADEDGLRKLRLAGFPYSLLYWTDGHESHVLAVAHAKRRPGYWKSRLEP
jgi:plasmid stabilization system protein ParE